MAYDVNFVEDSGYMGLTIPGKEVKVNGLIFSRNAEAVCPSGPFILGSAEDIGSLCLNERN